LEIRQIWELQIANPKQKIWNLTDFGILDLSGICTLGNEIDMGAPIFKP
jgi:hypothetical protein